MNEKKRKQKQYYVNQAKRAKFEKRKLHPGLRGFLCTTNNRERECVREAYNLLNEYANEMYGPEHAAQQESVAGSATKDVEQSLEAELAALKEEKVSKERRFQQVESGAKNCIFISTQLDQTSPLVERIAKEIQETGTQRTRYLLRLLPVQVTCKATEADIRASAEPMIKEAFTGLGVSYTTVFRSRNQAQLTQTDAQTAVNNLIDAVCPTARLDHKTPQLTVLMEVIRNVICLGVVRDYFQMKKYNLVELAKGVGESAAGGGEANGGGGEGETGEGNGEKQEGGDDKDLKGNGEAGSEAVAGQDVTTAAEGEEGADRDAGAGKDSSAAGGGGTGAEDQSSAGTEAANSEPPPPATEEPEKTPAADTTSTAASSEGASGASSAVTEGGGTAEAPVSDAAPGV